MSDVDRYITDEMIPPEAWLAVGPEASVYEVLQICLPAILAQYRADLEREAEKANLLILARVFKHFDRLKWDLYERGHDDISNEVRHTDAVIDAGIGRGPAARAALKWAAGRMDEFALGAQGRHLLDMLRRWADEAVAE